MQLVEYPLHPGSRIDSFAGLDVHARMLSDPERVGRLREALERTVRPGMRVVDIGAGTGILSIWCAELGAREVVAVEEGPLASLAEAICAANRVADRVTVLRRRSTDLEAERFDLAVAEVLGHIGIDEDILPVAADARRRLLSPGAPLVPGRVELRAAPAWAPALATTVDFWADRPGGVDMAAARPWVMQMPHLCPAAGFQLQGDWRRVAAWSPGEPAPMPMAVGGRWPARAGRVNAVALSFAAELVPGVHLDARRCHHWIPVLLPCAPRAVGDGETVGLELTFTGAGRAGAEWALTGGEAM